MPVTRNFQISHQWLRELRRLGGGTILGVYFRLPHDEPVEVGHFGRPGVAMTAAEAVALMFEAETRDPNAAREADSKSKAVARGRSLPSSPEGYQVLVLRDIARSEILRIKPLPQVVGWRYRPGANGSPPCSCICCDRGLFGVRKLLRRVEAQEAAGKPVTAVLLGR